MATGMINRQSQPAEALECPVINMDDLLNAALLKFKPLWEEKQIDLVGAFTVDAFAEADSVQTNQLVDWMLSHAIARTALGGEVFVSLEKDRNWVRISVADNGEAVPQEAQKPDLLSWASSGEYRNILTLQLPRVRR